jgi:uncharacterized RDD family membrane protein YckC
MNEQYYVLSKESNQSVGPMSEAEVRQWISQKLLHGNDQIARVGDSNWVSINQSPFAPLAQQTGSYPSANREMGRPQEYLQNYNPNRQTMAEPHTSLLLIRWVALMIDGLIATPLIFMAVFPFISLIGTPLLVAYLISRDALMGNGQSIGKRVMGLRVEKADGSPFEWVDSLKRNIVFFAYLMFFVFTIPVYGTFLGVILLIPLNIIFLVETIFVLATGKRMGDNIGKTQVVRAY